MGTLISVDLVLHPAFSLATTASGGPCKFRPSWFFGGLGGLTRAVMLTAKSSPVFVVTAGRLAMLFPRTTRMVKSGNEEQSEARRGQRHRWGAMVAGDDSCSAREIFCGNHRQALGGFSSAAKEQE
jgi:hypothetical protein